MPALLVLVTIVAVVVAGFASVVAKAFAELSLSKLEELARKRGQSAIFDAVLADRQRATLAAESVRVLFTVLASACLTWWFFQSWRDAVTPANLLVDFIWLAVFVLVLWAALIWIPSAVVRIWAEPLILATWRPARLMATLLSPVLVITRACEYLLRRFAGRPAAPSEEEKLEDELRSIVSEGHREGIIEEDAREMIESVIQLSDVAVAEIMTPRIYIVSLRADMPWEEVVKFVIDSGHSRIPVYGKSRDEIVGILHAKDVLAELARPTAQRRPLEEILRPAFFVPESKKVDELLPEFQKSRNHIAIVLDEFGGVSGLVTIEDAIEEIVGEIADEHDEALVDGIKCTSDTSCEALGRVPIEEINARLGTSLPEDQEFDTLAGFLFHELGRIPHVGEEVTLGDIRFRILDASRRRIDRVAIEVLRPQAERVE